jgi:hypothetical protein
MQHNGAQMAFVPLPNLVHLGAMSYIMFQRPSVRYKVRRLLPNPVAIFLRFFYDKDYRRRSKDERYDHRVLTQRHEAIKNYFSLLLHSGQDQVGQQYLRDLPKWLQQEVVTVGRQLQDIYSRYPLEETSVALSY